MIDDEPDEKDDDKLDESDDSVLSENDDESCVLISNKTRLNIM